MQLRDFAVVQTGEVFNPSHDVYCSNIHMKVTLYSPIIQHHGPLSIQHHGQLSIQHHGQLYTQHHYKYIVNPKYVHKSTFAFLHNEKVRIIKYLATYFCHFCSKNLEHIVTCED